MSDLYVSYDNQERNVITERDIVLNSQIYLELRARLETVRDEKSKSDKLAADRRAQLCAIEKEISDNHSWSPEYSETSALEAVKVLVRDYNYEREK